VSLSQVHRRLLYQSIVSSGMCSRTTEIFGKELATCVTLRVFRTFICHVSIEAVNYNIGFATDNMSDTLIDRTFSNFREHPSLTKKFEEYRSAALFMVNEMK
jgi:hypothetical protein